jgi:hypothetical protein
MQCAKFTEEEGTYVIRAHLECRATPNNNTTQNISKMLSTAIVTGHLAKHKILCHQLHMLIIRHKMINHTLTEELNMHNQTLTCALRTSVTTKESSARQLFLLLYSIFLASAQQVRESVKNLRQTTVQWIKPINPVILNIFLLII